MVVRMKGLLLMMLILLLLWGVSNTWFQVEKAFTIDNLIQIHQKTILP